MTTKINFDQVKGATACVLDFGARGDGFGTTPADEGVDISTAVWNTWDNTPFKTDLPNSPYSTGGGAPFTPPIAKPFDNTDTWDLIGINRALWNAKNIYIPRGQYVINLSGTGKGVYQGLLMMKGQEQSVHGDGFYSTTITPKENSAFFAANHSGTRDYYKLLTMFKTGGVPSVIENIGFIGPSSLATAPANLTHIYGENINGVNFKNLWLTVCDRGISLHDSSSDNTLTEMTSEYCFGETVYLDALSQLTIDFCNFWSSVSTNLPTQSGINAVGVVRVTNSRFILYSGAPIKAYSAVFANNYIAVGGGIPSSFNGYSTITGNEFSNGGSGPYLQVVNNSTITGNYFNQSVNHPCINVGDTSTALSATDIVITGNTFIKSDNAAEGQNYAILASTAIDYTGAAARSVLIANNTFTGRALEVIGAATMRSNYFNGAIGQTTGDVVGQQVTSGTDSSGVGFTITINAGFIGIGQGGIRDCARLLLFGVVTAGTGHECSGFAIYTAKTNGDIAYLATLGKKEVGGTLTFSSSGAYPICAVTNTSGDATIDFTANVIPLI